MRADILVVTNPALLPSDGSEVLAVLKPRHGICNSSTNGSTLAADQVLLTWVGFSPTVTNSTRFYTQDPSNPSGTPISLDCPTGWFMIPNWFNTTYLTVAMALI